MGKILSVNYQDYGYSAAIRWPFVVTGHFLGISQYLISTSFSLYLLFKIYLCLPKMKTSGMLELKPTAGSHYCSMTQDSLDLVIVLGANFIIVSVLTLVS